MDWLEYHNDPIKLHSGEYSHWFVNGDSIFSDGHLRTEVLDYWQEQLLDFPEPFNFIPIPRGGTRWAEEIAARVGGEVWDYIDACVDKGTYVVVDDVATTGKSLDIAGKQLYSSGARNIVKLVVVDRLGIPRFVQEFAQVYAWATIHLSTMEDFL